MDQPKKERPPQISIVSPVYGCRDCLCELCQRLVSAIETITVDFEIILVDDGSPDLSWNTVIELGAQDPRIKGIQLSRNFGQHHAIAAGLEHSSGEWIVVMDCDLQDQPEEIVRLHQKAREGFDIVIGKRIERKDHFFKRILSKLFYVVLSYLTNTRQDSTVANFGIYHKKVVRAVLSMQDVLQYFPAMVQWVGFNQTSIPVKHMHRSRGKSSYNFRKLLNLSLDVILGFSDKPLRLTVKLGLSISILAFLSALFFLLRYLQGGILVSGWTSLVITVLFMSGIIIFLMGILGLYIGKIFEKVKGRPKYIVNRTSNF